MKKYLFLFILFIAVFLFWRGGDHAVKSVDLRVGMADFQVEIADTIVSRNKGLADRESLLKDSGMFFVFERPQVLSFWMKGMRFPLDMIWIDGNKVIGFEKNVPLDDGVVPKVYYSPDLADKVLEINAGLVEKFGIKIGDVVELIK